MRSWNERVLIIAALTAVLGLAGCTDEDAPRETSGTTTKGPDELTVHAGNVCPGRLPQSEATDGVAGVEDRADSGPTLQRPTAAWVCVYLAGGLRAGEVPWTLDGGPRQVPTSQLTAIADDLAELRPAPSRSCTDDLGPRWMLVYANARNLTGVVIDDFGCEDVRLTDEPFETAPGDTDQEGVVRGVLAAPTGLLAEIKQAYRR